MEMIIFAVSLILGAVLAAVAIWGVIRINDERLKKYEALMRNRYLGGFVGACALAWCVPLAKVVVFDWMVPYLWPAAVLIAVLSYFYIDFLFGRALAGMFILLACYWTHQGFVNHLPLLGVLTVLSYVMGTIGIAISGKPCWSRDLIRALDKRRFLRLSMVVYLAFFAADLLFSGIWMFMK